MLLDRSRGEGVFIIYFSTRGEEERMPSDLGANENSKINNSTAFDEIDNGSLATMGGRDGRTLEPF